MFASSLRTTERARLVLAAAAREARLRKHTQIQPAHLLLAILRADSSVAAVTLDNLGINRNQLAEQLARRIVDDKDDPYSDESIRDLLHRAKSAASSSKHSLVGTEHLLLALVESESGDIHDVLTAKGLTATRILAEITAVLA